MLMRHIRLTQQLFRSLPRVTSQLLYLSVLRRAKAYIKMVICVSIMLIYTAKVIHNGFDPVLFKYSFGCMIMFS